MPRRKRIEITEQQEKPVPLPLSDPKVDTRWDDDGSFASHGTSGWDYRRDLYRSGGRK